MGILRYHQLVGKTVVDDVGQSVGRVADLAAERRGDALVVTAVLVGPAALIQRVGFRWLARLGGQAPCRVPWGHVARIDDRVHLRVSRSAIENLQRSGSEPEGTDGA